MKKLRLLTLSILLATFSATITTAQEGGGGCNPGNTQSPPCLAQTQPTDPEAPAPSTATTVSTTDVIAEVTLDLVNAVLAIF